MARGKAGNLIIRIVFKVVKVFEMGKTAMGKSMIYAVIYSKKNM